MYLSILFIDVGENPDRPRPGRMWLRNLYRVHQRLCMAFPSNDRKNRDPDSLEPYDPGDLDGEQVHVPRSENGGILFRVDPLPGGRAVILVQSALEPDWDYAFHNARYLLAAPPETTRYTPCFGKGQRLRFRLLANPTKKIGTILKTERELLSKNELKGKKGRHGRRVPVPADQLFEWLERRAEGAGFSVEENSVIIRAGYLHVRKSGADAGQRFRSARYDGVLEVVDPDAFHEAIIKGIGPVKAFGFGLLSVARCCA